jgi:hypothetical protein
MAPWYVDMYRWTRKRRAHVLTSEHLGFGNYRTACGKSMNVEYRHPVEPGSNYAKDNNILFCSACKKSQP